MGDNGLQVLNGNPYNRKCDVYSFGICLWEIYCCDMPYPDLSFSEITSAVVRQVHTSSSILVNVD
jgi:serine/threonine protein kinase